MQSLRGDDVFSKLFPTKGADFAPQVLIGFPPMDQSILAFRRMCARMFVMVCAMCVVAFARQSMAQPMAQDVETLDDYLFGWDMRVRPFDTAAYIARTRADLVPYTELIIDRAGLYSIHPKVVLTLIEASGIIGETVAAGLPPYATDTATHIDTLLRRAHAAFYDARRAAGITNAAPTANGNPVGLRAVAALYAELAARVPRTNATQTADGFADFVADYARRYNVVLAPAGVGRDTAKASPIGFLRLPWTVGLTTWSFNGLHNTNGSFNPPLSSIDFSNGWRPWDQPIVSGDTVRASHAGTVSVYATCHVRVTHSNGWATGYYHLESPVVTNGQSIAQGDAIGPYANDLANALCQGGSSTGPHVHFSLFQNGLHVDLDQSELSGWRVNATNVTQAYDYDCTHMWLSRDGVTVCPGYPFAHTLPPDSEPDPFSFSLSTNAPLNTLIVSNVVTITGLANTAPISIIGGSYRINGGAWTTGAGSIGNVQTVEVRVLSASTPSTLSSATLTIGGVSSDFNVMTLAPDTTPNAFSFTAQTNVALNTLMSSNVATITGINAAAPISIVNGSYRVNGGAWTTSTGTISSGQTVEVRVMSANTFSTTTSATLTVGGVSASFGVTTLPVDTTPNGFTFSAQTDAALGTVVSSNAVTITGINAAAPISIVGGSYRINGGAWTTAAGTIVSGQTVEIRQISAAAPATTTLATLTVGGVSAAFSVTTIAADTTPTAFSFLAQQNVPLSSAAISEAITVTGINTSAPISIVGGSYQINGGAWTSTAGNVSLGQTVAVQLLSAPTFGTATMATLTIGGMAGVFRATTRFACDLNVSGVAGDNATDGLLILRYLMGMRGSALIAGTGLANASGVEAAIVAIENTLDVDGDGMKLATTDGLMLYRMLLGASGTAVTHNALVGGGAVRSDWPSIRGFVNSQCGTSF